MECLASDVTQAVVCEGFIQKKGDYLIFLDRYSTIFFYVFKEDILSASLGISSPLGPQPPSYWNMEIHPRSISSFRTFASLHLA